MSVFADRVQETTITTGAGPLTLAGAVTGAQAFADVCAIGDTVEYAIFAADVHGNSSGAWEQGVGTYSASNTLTRTTVLASSNGGAAVNFASGAKRVEISPGGRWFRAADSFASTSIRRYGAQGNSTIDATGGSDDTQAFLDMCAEVTANGGGVVYVDDGFYRIDGSQLVIPSNFRFVMSPNAYLVTNRLGGGGANAGEDLANGSMLVSSHPSNASNHAGILIEGGIIRCADPDNIGAAFYDNCGTSIQIRSCSAYGFKHSVVLDQSELVDISGCDFSPSDSSGACVWLVNGGSLRIGNESGFTNRISIKSCQINSGASVTGILDDGGNAHSFVDNNYNGCLHHIRASNVLGLKINGGEFESATGANVVLSTLRSDGGVAGGCDAVCIDTPEITTTDGQSCISIEDGNMGSLTLIAPFFGNSTAAKVSGTGGIYALYSVGVASGGGGATFDGMAQNHWEVGNNGLGSIAITTNLPIPLAGDQTIDVDAKIIFDDVGGVSYQSYTEHVLASPFRYHSVVSQGGAGGWRGGYRLQLNYDGGTLFDALKIEANVDGTTAAMTLAGNLIVSGNVGGANIGSAAAAALDTDTALTANSDTSVPSQRAVKAAIATAVTGTLKFQGSTDCSGNPNYPAASKGDVYVVSVAGKIGGAAGTTVEIGDEYFAIADNAGGSQASVGASWDVLERNDTLATVATTGSAGDLVAGTLPAGRFPALTGDVTTVAGALAATIAAKAVTLAKMADVATATVFYRKTAGTGAPEVNTLATLKADLAITAGDVSGLAAIATSGSGADLGANTVALGKLATQAAATILGNNGGGAAAPSALTVAQVKTLLAIATTDVTPSVQSVANAATVTPAFSDAQTNITAQAGGLTLANWSGTAVPARRHIIRIKDNGSPQTIAYGTKYRAIGVTLPTTTAANKTLYLGCVYNSTDDKFDVLAVGQEA